MIDKHYVLVIYHRVLIAHKKKEYKTKLEFNVLKEIS